MILRIEVEETTGDRIDRFLADRLPLSRSLIANLIERGHVRVGDRTTRKSYIPVPGDVIGVEVPPPEPVDIVPEAIAVEIIYQDDGFLVVNKPPGMVVHPAPGHAHGTLLNALLHQVGALSPIGGARRPGVIHRLDKDTSGLVIVAKQEGVHRRLAEALARREIVRRYLAASWGHLPEDELLIEADVGRHRRDRKRMAVVPGSRPALTEIERLERWRAADFLRVRLHTGRTHQIRVHLRHIGHPVVGDRQYGAGWERGLEGKWPRELAARVPRQFLHAAELHFHHPDSGRLLEFEVPLPGDLADVADWARRTS
ncbi:MAG: RluA family pseudouridine synthase [Gemmatimonadota bacterium]|nr:MAG: RluA family pseudouridine synthase [Gemmatimonadota bacterium]